MASAHRGTASWRTKAAPLFGLTFTTIISSALLAAAKLGWTDSGKLYDVITENRASVQIAVQILAWILGTAQLLTVCMVIKALLNMHVGRKPLSLDGLKFWTALASARFDTALPPIALVLLFVFLVAIHVPSALWAGALTPVTTVANGTFFPIPLPQYSKATEPIWNLTCFECWVKKTPTTPFDLYANEGIFTYRPVFDTQGLLLTQAAAASSRNGTTQTHAKIDNTGYAYFGRSFGVGAAVGLFNEVGAAQSYWFHEFGYMSTVKCLTNATSDLALNQVGMVYDDESCPECAFENQNPDMWQAYGTLPNGPEIVWDFPTPSYDDGLTVLGLVASQAGGRYVYGFSPGYGQAVFTNMQCEVFYEPATFNVSVDTNERSINVTQASNPPAIDIESSGALKIMAAQQLMAFANVDSTTITSYVGDVLFNNMINVAAQVGLNTTLDIRSSTGNTTDAVRFRGVEESIESIVDNALLSFGMAQLMIAHDNSSTSALPIVNAIRLGKDAYVYLIFTINLLVLILYLVEWVRTGFWRDLSDFDCTSGKSLLIAASAGGDGIASTAKQWRGGDGDRALGKVSVMLSYDNGVPAIVPAASGKATTRKGYSVIEEIEL